jgi:hypothetical protein
VRGDDLARWDEAGARWVLDPLTYTLTVAANAEATGIAVTVRGR